MSKTPIDAFAAAAEMLAALRTKHEDRTPIRFAALVGAEVGGFTRPRGYESD